MKFYNKIIFAVILGVFTSCGDDFLNIKDPNQITSGSFWASSDDVQSALVTLYPLMNGLWDGAPEALNLRSDAVKLAAADFQQFAQFNTFINQPDNSISDGFWDTGYTMVFRANTILEQIEGIDFADEQERNIAIAEAQFFRGVAYFRIAQLYGAAPVVLEVPTDNFNFPASSAAEVWNQAETDLLAAKAVLPEERDFTGQVTWGATTGFLGKLYLHRAGFLDQASDYSLAAEQFSEVINSGMYGLIPEWNENFTTSNENNEESLYEAQYDQFTGSYAATQERPFNASVPGISGEIVSSPSQWIFDQMSAERDLDGNFDVRMLNTLYWEEGLPLFGVAFADLGDGLVCGSGDGGGGGGGDCTEEWDEDITGEAGFWDEIIAEEEPGAVIIELRLQGCWNEVEETETETVTATLDNGCRLRFDALEEAFLGNSCGETSADGGNFEGWFRKYMPVDYSCNLDGPAVNNERILRYSDILLMQAEALVMSGGSTAEAIGYVNQIRERVNLPADQDYRGNALTASNIMAEIEHQRVMEFTLEGSRYIDLIRWNKLEQTLTSSGFPDAASNIDMAKHKYFHYPRGEVLANEALDQKPEWN